MTDLLHSAAASSWANSAAPALATLSNTAVDTANSYDKLDGKFAFAAKAGAVTDWIVFADQVPAGYSLKIHGIVIDVSNRGAAVATTASLLDWSIVDSSAVSLVTSGSRRFSVGMQSFAVAAAIGAVASQINVMFPVPIVITQGRYAETIVRLPVGTATASQEFHGNVTLIAEYI